jgi:hypothetical protein
VVAGSRRVSKLSPGGDAVWSTALPFAPAVGAPLDLGVDAAGDVYVLGSVSSSTMWLTRLSPSGDVQWVRWLRGGSLCPGTETDPYAHPLAVAPGGDVAVLYLAQPTGSPATSTLAVFQPDGTPRWSHDTVASCVTVAASASGVWHVVTTDGTTTGNRVQRYDAGGSALATLPGLPSASQYPTSMYAASLVVEGNGDLAAAVTSEPNTASEVTVSHVLAAGTVAFSASGEIAASDAAITPLGAGLAVDAAGDLVAARAHLDALGVHVDAWGPDGAARWSLDKDLVPLTYFEAPYVHASAIAADGAGHVAIAGAFGPDGWIEVFTSP